MKCLEAIGIMPFDLDLGTSLIRVLLLYVVFRIFGGVFDLGRMQ